MSRHLPDRREPERITELGQLTMSLVIGNAKKERVCSRRNSALETVTQKVKGENN